MNPVTGLAIGRIVIGIAMFLSPRLGARIFRVDASSSAAPYFGRLFGSREIALGAVTLASSGQARTRLVAAGVAIDAADGAAGALSARDGDVSKVVSGLLIAPAAAAVVVGVAEMLRSRGAA
ncbi:MAG TPA: hypothetical protein VNS55_09855 [Nocardioides sp.]|nr:hypothetical protein [Nocardioides sp.]